MWMKAKETRFCDFCCLWIQLLCLTVSSVKTRTKHTNISKFVSSRSPCSIDLWKELGMVYFDLFLKKMYGLTYLHGYVYAEKRPCVSSDCLFSASQGLLFSRQEIATKEIWQKKKWAEVQSDLLRNTFKTCRKIWQHFLNFRMTFILMSSFICTRRWSSGQAHKIRFPFELRFLRKLCDGIHVGEFYNSTASLCEHSLEKT